MDSIGAFRARRAAGDLPAGVRAADVFVVIDNWGALRTEYEDAEAIVTEIAARGLGVGIHLVLTANRWSELRSALRESIGSRMELRLNDPLESETSRVMARQMTAAPAGRALVPPGAYCQIVLPRIDGVPDIEGLRESLAETLAGIARNSPTAPAPAVRLLPARIDTAELAEPVTPGVPLGVREPDLATVGVDLLGGDPHLVVLGDTGAGKTSCLRTWIQGCLAGHSPDQARLVLVDYRRSLVGTVPPAHLAAYAGNADAARVYAVQLADKLRTRLPPADVSAERLARRDWWQGPEIYLVVDDYDLVATAGAGPLAPLAEFLPHAREVGLHLVLARRVSGYARTGSDPVFTRVRELGCTGLVLSGDRREGTVLGDERPSVRPPGRGVLVRRGQPGTLMQVATATPLPRIAVVGAAN